MKRDISDAFSSNGAAAEFAQELVRRAPRLGRVVLVGHSAGSLWVLKLMESVRRAEQVGSSPLTVDRTRPPIQFDVILLAPAATYGFVADKLQAWDKVGYQPFRTFHMHILTDSAERKNGVFGDANFKEQFRQGLSGLDSQIGDVAGRFGNTLDTLGLNSYPGSLLFLVSLFEYPDIYKYPPPHAPLLGMQYYLDPISRITGDAVDRLHHVWANQYLLDGPDTIETWPLPDRAGPRTHSDFLHDPVLAAHIAAELSGFGADPDWRQDVHVLPGSIATGFSAQCSPPRHLSVLAAPGLLTVGLDHETVALVGGHDLRAHASVSLTGPSTWLSGANSLDVTFVDALRKTALANLEIMVSMNGVSSGWTRLETGAIPTFHFSSSNRFAGAITISVETRASRLSAVEWCAMTLHSMSVVAR